MTALFIFTNRSKKLTSILGRINVRFKSIHLIFAVNNAQ
jgi:hypothetical protein